MKEYLVLYIILVIAVGCDSFEDENIIYYDTGEVKEIQKLENNVKDGLQIFYYKSGGERVKVFAKNGLFDGEYMSYYENGTTKSHGFYLNDSIDGAWKYYDENGRLEIEGEYSKGDMVGEWNYRKHKTTIEWQNFKSKLNNFKISVPNNWRVNDEIDGILLAGTSEIKDNNGFSENFNILEYQIDSAGFNLKYYVEDYIEKLEQEIKEYDVLIERKSEMEPNKKMIATYVLSSEDKQYKVLGYFLIDNNRLLVLSFYSDKKSFDKSLFLYEDIINSLTIIN